MSERATKKQQELLSYIDGFIKSSGYGPSYREVMRALGYKSVSTVAIHIDGLVAAGYLKKNGRSARSLEVLDNVSIDESLVGHREWLQRQFQQRLAAASADDAAALRHVAALFDVSLNDFNN